MNTCDRLLRARFNPCADRVEAIGRYIDGMLDAAAEAELSAHIETCHRCRGYRLFLEAADHGFREDVKSLSIVPALTAELPTPLQEAMVETLKRNLSRWLSDAGRALMYREGMISPFFLDLHEAPSFDEALLASDTLLRSIRTFKVLSKEDAVLVDGVALLLQRPGPREASLRKISPLLFFSEAISIHKYNHYAHCYQAEILLRNDELDSAIDILRIGIERLSPSSKAFKSFLLNNIGVSYLFAHKLDVAKDWLNKARDADKEGMNPLPALNTAQCFLEDGEPDLAYERFIQAMELCEKVSPPRLSAFYRRYSERFIHDNIQHYRDAAQGCENLTALALRFGSTLS